MDTSPLFQPISLACGSTLRNRLVVAPMTTYSSHADGTLHEEEVAYLRVRSRGFGAVMTAACCVHPRGKAFDGQWACWDDGFLPSLRKAAEAIQSQGAAAILQIHHGGRQCPSRLCGGPPLSASAVPAERPNAETPVSMSAAEIEETIAAFASAAARAKAAGFDGVEIHGANTYLLQQFVSPHSNRREDDYGLDPFLFPWRIASEVRAAVGPSFAVGYRFSPEETETPGIRLPHTLQLLDRLLTIPLDWLHISLRDFRGPSLLDPEGEPVQPMVARHIGGRTAFVGVGGVKNAADALDCLRYGADLVAVGRAAITDPDWALKALHGEDPILVVPAEGAREKLTLPTGLANKIYGVPGWFPVEGVNAPA
jgi:2,4-dienoyl-CoA reductase-like NADH-dependent reductase (Old Yellow Enzyme family)